MAERNKSLCRSPKFLEPYISLFFAGYFLAFVSIWQWYRGVWPLPLLVATAFLALHIEGTVIHDACHKAAHPVPWINQAMGHGSAILLGFSSVFTRVHLQHHIHVNHPKNDPDHIVSTFGPIWLIAPRFSIMIIFFKEALEKIRINAMGNREIYFHNNYLGRNKI